ncbi:type II toxin-antitoxin system Phd/YefM family antitoxin [Methylobacterium sp. EM32]|uniref:type II toxin-antitoxin system Phd/YefM family antitoxin n=1 Tax=Methylobacterium sp. EM32 TaxID=3163481 RepID=UPI0033B68487
MMHESRLREAIATLSALIDHARRGEPSATTRDGRRESVLPGDEEWQRLAQTLSFGRLLMSAPLDADDLPPRDGGMREIEF